MTTTHDSSPLIVVGVDGSESAVHALRWAVDEARLRGARQQVVHAWQIPSVGLPGLHPPYPDEDFVAYATALIDTAVAGLHDHGDLPDLERTPIKGHTAAALIEASANAILLVVGSHGHGGVTGTLLGSVSQRVAAHAHCPVVIVRTKVWRRHGPQPRPQPPEDARLPGLARSRSPRVCIAG